MSDSASSLLDPAVLRHILGAIESSDVAELEVVFGDTRLFLRREHRSGVGGGSPQVESGGRSQPEEGVAVIAPLTGVFYRSDGPEKPAFVTEGDVVEVGQTLALIETMKLFNEIPSDVAGVVLRIVAQDRELVEVGKPLMYIRSGQE